MSSKCTVLKFITLVILSIVTFHLLYGGYAHAQYTYVSIKQLSGVSFCLTANGCQRSSGLRSSGHQAMLKTLSEKYLQINNHNFPVHHF